eukprot:988949-Lingulodinium_polyedra.AAC.1
MQSAPSQRATCHTVQPRGRVARGSRPAAVPGLYLLRVRLPPLVRGPQAWQPQGGGHPWPASPPGVE